MTGTWKKLRLATALVLAVLMVVLIPVQAGAIVTPNAPEASDTASEETEPPSILAEVEEDRDEYTKHFRLSDGSYMAVQYEYPIHYEDKDGEWVEYNNSMKEADTQTATDTPVELDTAAGTSESPASTTEQTAPASSIGASAATAAVSEPTTEAASIEGTEASTDTAEPAALDDENAEYANKKSDLDIRLSKKAKKTNMVKIKGDGYQVSWGFPGINKSRVEFVNNDEKLEGNDKYLVRKNLVQEALYRDVFPNIDLQYLVTPVGVKENVILKNRDAQTTFEIEYKMNGLTAVKKNDYTIALQNKDGKVVYEIYAPFMVDAKGEKSTQLRMEITSQKSNKLTIVLSADEAWLNEACREYPVTIDPSFNTSREWQNTACSYVDQSHPTTAYGYGSESGYTGTVYAGTLGGIKNYRTYLKMNNLPTLNKGDVVIGAYLNMYLYQNGFYDNMYVGAYHVSGIWKQSTITWNNKPSFESTAVDYETFVKNDPNEWHDWDVTKSVKRWYNGESNNGIMLKPVDEADNAQCASFFSSNYPDVSNPRPVFSIVYRNNKGLEDYWTYTSFEVGTAGMAYVNDYTGNLVFVHNDSATAGDRMPVNVQHVYNNYMAGVKYAKNTPYVGRGWRLNYQQTLLPSSTFGLTGSAASRYPYVYTDGDGTEHYIYKKVENGETTYQDEDGLNLILTVNTSSKYARYKLTDEKDNFYEFDTNGLLRKMIDANGNYLTVKYSDTNEKKIIAIRDGAIENNVAKQVAFIETASGTEYVSQMRDPAGRLTTFFYTDGTLNQIKNPDGNSIFFTYDTDGSITSIKDIDGYTIKFGYSSAATGKQVINVVEYGTDGTVGQRVTFDRSKYNTTVIHSAGLDGVYSNDTKADDLYTTMQFDNNGRTLSYKSKTGQRELGAAGCQYTSGSPNSSGSNLSQINRVTNEYNLGSNAINLVPNSNMETGSSWKSSEWGGTTSFTGAYTTEQKYLGKQSYKLNVTAYTGLSIGRAYQEFSNTILKPGTTYTLSAYVKTAGMNTATANTGAMIAVNSLDASGAATNFFSDYIKSSTETGINGGWRRLTLTFKVPADSAKTRINLCIRGAIGNAYFDAVQLEQYNMANPYNMIENSSLENYSSGAPVGWTCRQTTSSDGQETTNANRQNGTSSYRIVGEPGANKELVQTINVTGNENDTYIVSAWAKANAVEDSGDESRRFNISIRVVYSDGSISWRQAAQFNKSISDWQFASSAFTLSDDNAATKKTSAKIEVYLRYHSQANKAYFDNVQLIKDVSQSYTYDEDGNVISVQKDAEQKSTMEYNNSNLTKSIDAKGYAYTYNYDGKHNMTKATSQRGLTYNYTYGQEGRPTQLEALNPNKEAGLKSTVTYTGNKAFVNKTGDQDGNEMSYVFDQNRGTLLSATDSYGTVNYSYNENNNRLSSVSKTLEDGTVIANQYTYTTGTNRNLVKVSHAGTNYGITYDVFNNKTATTVGSQTMASYTYGANNGFLQQQTYGTGQYVGFTYDAFGNVATQSYNGITAFKWFADRTGDVTRHEDLVNGIRQDSDYDVTGRLVRETAVSTANNQNLFSLELEYDTNNNVSKLINITNNKTARNAYVYGKDNLLEKYTIDNSRDVSYQYDSLNRLTKKSIATTSPLTMEYLYWKSDRAKSGTTEYKTTKISEETIAGEKLAYYYDERGNITEIKKMVNGSYTTIHYYEYDDLGELVYATDNENNRLYQYNYDEGGNILCEIESVLSNGRPISTTTKNYDYSDANWRDKLTSYDGASISYDSIGNPLSYRGMTMSWKNGRQLSTLQKGSTAVSYTYDSGSVRTTKTVNGEKYTYQYTAGKLIYETRGEKSFHYYYDADGHLTAIKYRLTPTGSEYSYYVTHNWRGDIVGIYSGSGVLTAKYEYDSWGNVVSIKNGSGAAIADQNNIGNLNPFRYRGYYYDAESGLYYLMTRYYDPVTHRFINADGYFHSGKELLDVNMNAYCDNNPINSSDPTGEDNNCPIHKNHWFQSNCVTCRPEYQAQLDKEMKRGQQTWKPDGGTSSGGTMAQANGVSTKTDKLTYIPPDLVKDLYKVTKNHEWDAIVKAISVADLMFGTRVTGGILLTLSLTIEMGSSNNYDKLCTAIEIASENGNGLVIIEAPYCDDPRAAAGKSWTFNQYDQWAGKYGEYPYAKNPFG